MRHRFLAPIPLLPRRLKFLLPLPLLACSWNSRVVRSEDFERTTMQVGVIEAPTGPHGLGPQLGPGQVGLQGALEYGVVPEATGTRSEGASGALLATGWARGQATFGVARWLQLGVEVEGSPVELARPVATDISADGWSGVEVRGGVNMRAHWQTGVVALEPFAEVEASGVRWFHNDTVTETVTDYGDGGTSTTEVRADAEFKRGAYVSGRVGLGMAFGKPGRIQVRAGPYVTNDPWLFGSWSDHWGCDYYAGGGVSCTDPSREPDQVSTIIVPGIFGNLTIPLGQHVVVSAGGWLDGVPSSTGTGDSSGDTIRLRPGATASLEFILGKDQSCVHDGSVLTGGP